MRRYFLLVALILSIGLSVFVHLPTEASGTKVFFDGIEQSSLHPLNHNNSLYLPLRDLGKLLGAKVAYEKTSQGGKVKLSRNKQTITLFFDTPYLFSDEDILLAEQKPLVLEGKSYLPLRSVSEAFGLKLTYDGKKGQVKLSSKTESTGPKKRLDYSYQGLISTGELSLNPDLTLTYGETPKEVILFRGACYLRGKSNRIIDYFEFLKTYAPERFYKESKIFIFEAVSEARQKSGLAPLFQSPSLEKGADRRAVEIASFYSHTRPCNKAFFTVLEDMGLDITNHGIGENIAYGQENPIEVFNAWMKSKGHRENILDKAYKTIGVGVSLLAHQEKGDEGFLYKEHWAQLFDTEVI